MSVTEFFSEATHQSRPIAHIERHLVIASDNKAVFWQAVVELMARTARRNSFRGGFAAGLGLAVGQG